MDQREPRRPHTKPGRLSQDHVTRKRAGSGSSNKLTFEYIEPGFETKSQQNTEEKLRRFENISQIRLTFVLSYITLCHPQTGWRTSYRPPSRTIRRQAASGALVKRPQNTPEQTARIPHTSEFTRPHNPQPSTEDTP